MPLTSGQQFDREMHDLPEWVTDKTHPLREEWNADLFDQAFRLLETASDMIGDLEKTIEKHERQEEKTRDALHGLLLVTAEATKKLWAHLREPDEDTLRLYFTELDNELAECAEGYNLEVPGYYEKRIVKKKRG